MELNAVKVERGPSRIKEWSKLIAITGSAQVAVQAIGFACGILVIRLLPPSEYAIYTLANTMLGMMTLLADGGIANGVMAEGGKVWKEKGKLGAVFVTGMNLRKKFAIFSLLVATPILLYLLQRHGASWLTAILIVISLAPAFFSALSGTLLEIAPKLNQDIAPLQRIQVSSNAGRLFMTGLFVFAFPFAGVAILASGVAQMYANLRLRKLAKAYADPGRAEDPEVRRAILKIVKRVMPGAIYGSFSGQITILLISIFGSTEDLAQVGALGRLAAGLAVLGVMINILIVPRFARLQSDRRKILSRYFQTMALVTVTGFAGLLVTWAAPDRILWILGGDYGGLTALLILVVMSAVASLISRTTHALGTARGIIVPPIIFIPVVLLLQLAAYSLIDLTRVSEIVIAGAGVAVAGSILRSCYFAWKF